MNDPRPWMIFVGSRQSRMRAVVQGNTMACLSAIIGRERGLDVLGRPVRFDGKRWRCDCAPGATHAPSRCPRSARSDA